MKKIKNIYSKKNIEGLVNDIVKFLYKNELCQDVFIYFLNKRYKFYQYDENSKTLIIDGLKVYVDENIDVKEWTNYCNPKTVTIVCEGKLMEHIYYGDTPHSKEIFDKFNKIFEKHGFYFDFGDNCTFYAEEL